MSNNSTNRRLRELLDEYWEMFNDMFPTMDFQDESKEDICKRIEQCIQKGKKAGDLFGMSQVYTY